ncbi:MAG: hypothetical protein ACREPT_01005 [Rudaea sp.]
MRGRSSPASRHAGGSRRSDNFARELRARIAADAARLISESGLRDYHAAARKAAQRLGAKDDCVLPKADEIEGALRAHQQLFAADQQPLLLRRLRETARDAMRFFAHFEPRLVGAVLEGTADRHSAVCLHLFSDDADAPARLLDEHGIPCEHKSRRLRLTQDTFAEYPVLLFAIDSTQLDLTVLAYDSLRHAPMDRTQQGRMRRATLSALEELLA